MLDQPQFVADPTALREALCGCGHLVAWHGEGSGCIGPHCACMHTWTDALLASGVVTPLAEAVQDAKAVAASRDRWRRRAKQAQNEVADLRSIVGIGNDLWTPEDSIRALEARLESERSKGERIEAEAADERAAKAIVAEAADRFRDVLSEALGYPDENPGDDVLVATLREHFDKTGPEPTRWRNFVAGAKAQVDQINAGRTTLGHPSDDGTL